MEPFVPPDIRALDAVQELARALPSPREDGTTPPFEARTSDELHRRYGSLLGVILRLVFVLHAEALGILDPTVTALYDELRGARTSDARAWPRLDARLHAIFGARGAPLSTSSYDAPHDASRLTDDAVLRVLDALLVANGQRVPYGALDVELLGSVYERMIGFTLACTAEGDVTLQANEARRRSGSHYTSRALTEPIVRATLRPLLTSGDGVPRPEEILAVTVCDPAMGGGAFLVETCRQLADALVESWRVYGAPEDVPPGVDPVYRARGEVARRCLYGVDRDPYAVDLARLSLWLVARAGGQPLTFVDHALRCGDSLVGLTRAQAAAFHWKPDARSPALPTHATRDDLRVAADCVLACFLAAPHERERREALSAWRPRVESWLAGSAPRMELDAFVAKSLRGETSSLHPFHWELEFPEVFERGGFDAVVGNPPWVSYAGRAAQPLDATRRRFYRGFYESFAGYRNLQGLFVERAARLLRAGGRMGLVLPSSMAELNGYAPTRAAHDRLALCDPELPDLGEDSFRGVFQPSMVLRSTRASAPVERVGAPWPIERPDVDDEARAILGRFERDPLPPELFGERGLQTSGDDTAHFRDAPDGVHAVPLRVGGDIHAFARRPPSLHADVAHFGARLRPPEEWRRVRVLIRQTARVPIAALSDGHGFRNSILAGFASERYPADFLVAYLNATPVRWHHYYRNRDARLGMPQVKIGHLRAIPAPPDALIDALAALGAALSAENAGITPDAQQHLDALVCDAFGLSSAERSRVARDAEAWR